MNSDKIHFNRGQAMLVATMFFLAVSLTIIFGLVGPIVTQQKIVSDLFTSRQGYFLAEAGVEDVVYRLRTGKPVDATEVLTLGGSSVTTVTTTTIDGKEVVGTGEVRESIRKVKVNLMIGNGVAFHYGIQVGTGGFVLANNAGVNGNVYSNTSIIGSNGSFITGSASAVESISGVTIGTTGTGDAHAPTVTNSVIRGNLFCQTGSGNNKPCTTPTSYPVTEAFPIPESMITAWKDEAALGGTVGTQNLTGITNILGPKKIEGNLNIGIGGKLTVNGTLWITGNLVLSNSSELALTPDYGSSDGIIIVEGTTTFSNNAVFAGSGASNSFIMLLSTNTTTNAVSVSNNSAGAVIVYAPYGTVHLNNGANIQQISAKTISIAPNATIEYEQGMINASFTSGPSGGYEINSWQEIE